MKRIVLIVAFLCLSSTFGIAQTKQCSANPDNLYKRQAVLEQFARILEDSVPEIKDQLYVRDERSGRFKIHDLTNPDNNDTTNYDNCVDFINGHVYHVYPSEYIYSFSHIIILEDGKFKVFKSLNCKSRGDSIETVITYLNQKLDSETGKDEIIERVKNYRKYGSYLRICRMEVLQCH
jgi:hypothetical protein